MNVFDSLTGFYPLAKSLPIKLTPMGRTAQSIQEAGIIENDEELLEDFVRLKQIADDYHKEFISSVLENFKFKLISDGNNDSLEDYVELYESDRKNNAENRASFENVRATLRQKIAKAFEAMPAFRLLDKKEFVNDILRSRVVGSDVAIIDRFSTFTSYLASYYKNRMIYGSDFKKNTIAYRCIEDNLPIFYNNVIRYRKIRKVLPDEVFEALYKNLEPYLNVNNLDELFRLDYFNEALSQKQIEVYNAVLGGYNTQDNHIIGLNQYISNYNQVCTEKSQQLPALISLKKQILSDRVVISWRNEKYVDSRKMLADIETFHKAYVEHVDKVLKQLLTNIRQYDANGIFITNDDSLTQISHRLCGNWDALKKSMFYDFERKIKPRKRKETPSQFEKRVEKAIKERESFSFVELNDYLGDYGKDMETYFSRIGAVDSPSIQRINYFAEIQQRWTDLYPTLKRNIKASEPQSLAQGEIDLVKAYLDALMSLYHFVLPLKGCGNENGKDMLFYEGFDNSVQVLEEMIGLYNRVRDFLTRKPYSTEKIKLNFGSPNLLKGWSRSNERSNRGIVFRKDGRHYLAILERGVGELFPDEGYVTGKKGEGVYEKVYYESFGDAAKNLPGWCFAQKNIGLYQPSPEILRIRKEESYKAGKTFNREDMHKIIDYYKKCVKLMPKWKDIDFHWKETQEYNNLKEFTDEFTGNGYVISFAPFSETYINQLVDEGKIYLFRMDNRDLSPYSKGRKSLNTLYFEMLFHPDNLKNVVYKLCGGAEIFFRKASIKPGKPTHPAGLPIDNKRPEVACRKPQSVFSYDLVKDKRFTVDQFMLHMPVAINYSLPEIKGMRVTSEVRNLIRKGMFKHIIGIHRGENNLLYVCVLDMKGNIVEQGSLNVIEDTYQGITHAKDYNELLQRRGDERQQARRDWRTIDKIRDIKKGYLSQVIHVITEMILKYEAVVVLESLDDQFKKSRQKIEKNIYQQFEQQLVDKLNFLVKKTRGLHEPGGLLNGLQLTDRVTGSGYFQNGVIFYVPAAYTASVCPVTGFVNFFQIKKDKMDDIKSFFCKFDSIRFNKQTGYFDFAFDYKNFTKKVENARTQWTLSTFGKRVQWYTEKGVNRCRTVDLTEEFKQLFTRHGVDFTGNLKEAIATIDKRSFYDELVALFLLLVQVRNIDRFGQYDYIVSPVADKEGCHFMSSPDRPQWPVNTDANSAYNIARKGKMMIEAIAVSNEGDKVTLGITNERWFQYIQAQELDS